MRSPDGPSRGPGSAAPGTDAPGGDASGTEVPGTDVPGHAVGSREEPPEQAGAASGGSGAEAGRAAGAGARAADASGSQSAGPVAAGAGGVADTVGALPTWLKGVLPLVLLAGLVFTFLRTGPIGVFEKAFPPVEELTIARITLPEPGVMRVRVVNGGPEGVTVSQVLVDDAAWAHTIDGARRIERLGRRTITIPYPWVEGDPHEIVLVTSTGVTFPADVEVATQTPSIDARYLTTFAVLGAYVGIIPVFLGLLWLPYLRGLRRRWIDFFLSLTIGLLVFLGVDALAEALETAEAVPGAFQGLGLVLLGVIAAPLGLAALGQRRRTANRGERSAMYVAFLIAVGIGLHNLGEGLVVGTAYATGEIALGSFLVLGFLLHNTTEGLGIVAPIAHERPGLGRLAALGAIAGVPTVFGAWIGGFAASPVWITLFFAIGAGAIVQVVYELWHLFARREGGGLAQPLNAAGLALGLAIMYATGLFVAA